MTEKLAKLLDSLMWQLVALSGTLDLELKNCLKRSIEASPEEVEVIRILRRICGLVWNRPTAGYPDRMKYLIAEGERVLLALRQRSKVAAKERRRTHYPVARATPTGVSYRNDRKHLADIAA